nr:hypothetical protein Iba_chr13bCG12710 [Ipomoea batatas]GMD81279.1 hypothetical protein Iba_chr13eCG10060 [Ipomoea batatas]
MWSRQGFVSTMGASKLERWLLVVSKLEQAAGTTGTKGRSNFCVSFYWVDAFGVLWVSLNSHYSCLGMGFKGFVFFGIFRWGFVVFWLLFNIMLVFL